MYCLDSFNLFAWLGRKGKKRKDDDGGDDNGRRYLCAVCGQLLFVSVIGIGLWLGVGTLSYDALAFAVFISFF
jgi:hypothetical protein